MTIIWDQDAGKLYSEFKTERDNFAKWHRKEITMEYAKHLCRESHDFILVTKPRGDEE